MTSRRNFITGSALVGLTGVLVEGNAAAATPEQRSFSGDKSYAATATPRPWTLPQRPTPPISIDMHTHWAPAVYLKAKADLGQPDHLDPINHNMDRRVELMNTQGVQMGVLTLGGFRPWVWVTPEQGAKISRSVNDEAMAVHKKYPKRFVAGIELNCSDPVGALAELNRVAGKPGMVCIHMPTSLGGKDFLFDDAFAPVLARAHDLGLPIALHPLDGQANWFGGMRLADAASGVNQNEPLARFPGLTNSAGNSLEVAVTMTKIISSGILDKYPNLNFIMCCSSGAIPFMAGRLEARGDVKYKRPVYQYLRQFYYDSLTFWPVNLRYLAEMVGADRIVLGSDNMAGPGNQITEYPHSVIDQANLIDEDRDLILRGNLKRLFKLA